jgi:hypothetical protein
MFTDVISNRSADSATCYSLLEAMLLCNLQELLANSAPNTVDDAELLHYAAC